MLVARNLETGGGRELVARRLCLVTRYLKPPEREYISGDLYSCLTVKGFRVKYLDADCADYAEVSLPQISRFLSASERPQLSSFRKQASFKVSISSAGDDVAYRQGRGAG
jgi:hypothetical protein